MIQIKEKPSGMFQGTPFDLVVIDEAAQALEIACWNALLLAPRCVLAGDHLQLPPTVQSEEAEKNGLGITLFERLAGLLGEKVGEIRRRVFFTRLFNHSSPYIFLMSSLFLIFYSAVYCSVNCSISNALCHYEVVL